MTTPAGDGNVPGEDLTGAVGPAGPDAQPETEAQPDTGVQADALAGTDTAGRADGPAGEAAAGPAAAGTPVPADEAQAAGVDAGETGSGPAHGGEPADSGEPADGDQAGPGLAASLEAILLVVDEPVAEVVLAQVLERPRHEVAAALRQLAASYDEESRGFELRQVAGGWRYYTREACAPVVERFVRDGQEVRLTQAALETLAVVAYRQPVSRARVSAVRGVNCDGVMRTLSLRGLVEEAGTERETGAILYRTTGYFLERLGLASLDDLPERAPFLPDQIEEHEETGDERAGS